MVRRLDNRQLKFGAAVKDADFQVCTSEFNRNAPMIAIDKIDARILRALQADGRISNLKLAEAVHLSPTAVLERVKRLTRDGVILGYEARLNPALLGAGLLVFIEVLLDRTVHDVMDKIGRAHV